MTLTPDEYNTMPMPVMKLDRGTELSFEHEGSFTLNDGVMGEGISSALSKIAIFMSSVMVVIPYLAAGVFTLLYALAVGCKRLVRHRLDDSCDSRPIGRVLLLITAGLSLCVSIYMSLYLIQIFTKYSISGLPVMNRTVQRMSQVLGIGMEGYLLSDVVLYLVLGVLLVRSRNHQLSRIRAARLALTLLLLNTISLVTGVFSGTISAAELAIQFVPLLALISLPVARVYTARDRIVGRRWLPLVRAIVATALLYLLRQLLLVPLEADSQVLVALKLACGLPVLVLALLMWRERATRHSGLIALAMLLYFAANGVINLNMTLGMALFMLGHLAMVSSFLMTRKPSRLHVLVWLLLSVFFLAQAWLIRKRLDTATLAAGVVYAVTVSALVAFSLPVSRRAVIGTCLMLMSNQLLVVTLLMPEQYAVGTVELLLYYISLLCLAADPEGLVKHGASFIHPRDGTPADGDHGTPVSED